MNTLLAVVAGGALGAAGRYLVMSGVGHWLGDRFPFATLAVNIVGCFALGVLVALGETHWSGAGLHAFAAVGLLGAFTTFSTFSLDVALRLERGERRTALAYIAVSVVLSIAGFFAGHRLAGAIAW